MKLALLLTLFGFALAAAPTSGLAQSGCVTQTLSLLVYYEDASETAAPICPEEKAGVLTQGFPAAPASDSSSGSTSKFSESTPL